MTNGLLTDQELTDIKAYFNDQGYLGDVFVQALLDHIDALQERLGKI